MVDPESDGAPEHEAQSLQSIFGHVFSEGDFSEHSDEGKGQKTDPCEGLGDGEISTDHSAEGILIFQFFDLFFTSPSGIVMPQ